MSRILLLLSVLLVSSSSAAAQVTGRWTVTLSGGAAAPMRGELRLVQQQQALAGTLRLEGVDTSRMPITEGAVKGDGSIEFRAFIGVGARFSGRLTGDEIHGVVFIGPTPQHDWRSTRLRETDEYYSALPRFALKQIVIGGEPGERWLPGVWIGAARANGETPQSVVDEYLRDAERAGLSPLQGDTLVRGGLLRAMGLYRRAELSRVHAQTLAAIRAGIGNDTVRARFDGLFRPAGEWLIDIHDVARMPPGRSQALAWDSAAPALEAAGLFEQDLPPGTERVPLTLYRLFVVSRADSTGFQRTFEEMQALESVSAQVVQRFLNGYARAVDWYARAMRFLATERWLPEGGAHSIRDRMNETWHGAAGDPVIRSHLFGYPEGAQRVGVDRAMLAQLISTENGEARDWLQRHGVEGMTQVLRRLPGAVSDHVLLDAGSLSLRLTSVEREARQSFGGFLEPRDEILLDPSCVPLFAVGTLVHEWQHILHERARRDLTGPGRSIQVDGEAVVLLPPDLYLAEGLAEWRARETLAPVIAKFPLVAVGEAEKRATMALSHPNDPHLLGYLMVRALSKVIPEPDSVAGLLTRWGADARKLAQQSPVAAAWKRFASQPDQSAGARSRRALIPETRFTVEDGVPQVLSTRIVVPWTSVSGKP